MKVTKWVGISVAVLLLSLAVLFSAARMLSPYLLRYKPQLEAWASQTLQRPVTIDSMAVGWRGLEPIFTFYNVALWDESKNQSVLAAKKVRVGISLWRSLFSWDWRPDLLVIAGTQLNIQQTQTSEIIVNGIPVIGADDKTDHTQAAEALLAPGQIRLQDVNVTWHGKDGTTLTLASVGLRLVNHFTGQHQLAGMATLVQGAPTRLDFVADFSGKALSLSALRAKIYFYVQRLDLTQWAGRFSYAGLRLKSGQGDFKGWLNWQDGRLQSVQSEMAVNDLLLASHSGAPDNAIDNLTGELRWERQTDGWSLQGNALQLQWNGDLWPTNRFSLQWTAANANQPGKQILQATFVNLANVRQFLLASALLDDAQRAQLTALQPSGLLHNLTLQQEGDVAAGQGLSAKTRFEHISWQPWRKLPGVTHLTGDVQWDKEGGTLHLSSQQLQLNLPALFSQSVPLGTVAGRVQWQKTANGWQLAVPQLSLDNAVFAAQPKLQLSLPTDGASPVIDLAAAFSIADLHRLLLYLPNPILSAGLVRWLNQANISGQAPEGSLVLQGALRQFPFDPPQTGRFAVHVKLQDAGLHYAPGWPLLSGISGAMDFAGRSLTITADSAQTLNSRLKQVRAVFPDLDKPILQITGQAQGNLQEGLAFVRQSPLQQTVGKNLQGLDLQGPMNLALQLVIPLEDKADQPVTVLGKLPLQNATLVWQPLGIGLTQLQGMVQFTHDGLAGSDLRGNLLGQPLTLNLTTLPATKNQPALTQVSLAGTFNTAAWQQQFPSPWWRYVQGATQYQATLRFPTAGDEAPNTLQLTSNLKGIRLDLPPPLQKTTEHVAPTTLTAQFAANQPLQLLVNYANQVSAALTYAPTKQGYSFSGGELHFGADPAKPQKLPGLLVTGQLAAFDWQAWRALFQQDNQQGVATAKGLAGKNLLRGIEVSAPQFTIGGQTLRDLNLSLQPVAAGWTAEVTSDGLAGQLVIPATFPQGTLKARLSRLYWQPTADTDPTILTPAQAPSLDVVVNDFRYDNKAYGHVRLLTTSQADQVEVNRLQVKMPFGELRATGQWRAQGKVQQTRLAGTLQSPNVGRLLSDLDMTTSLAGGQGTTDFRLDWPGAPMQFATDQLNGQIALKILQGRIVNLSQSTQMEIGLGRLLNLLSLQTIPRRLRLDFSDLTDKGFAFDILQGNLKLANGNVTTSDTYLNGPVARITLSGRIGLQAKDYDVFLAVTPYVTSSLPAVVATVAGGPVVGAATWVAGEVFSGAFGKLTTYRYQVTGSWQQPSVTKLPTLSQPKANAAGAGQKDGK